LQDILDYSKIEAGELTLNPSSHNVADVVEAAVMLCQSGREEQTQKSQIRTDRISLLIRFAMSASVRLLLVCRCVRLRHGRFEGPLSKLVC
jgi:signal transduction histidine kinase